MSTLTISEAIDQLGAAHVAAIVRSGHAYWGPRDGRSFAGRATGQWMANSLDNYAAYVRLSVQVDWCEVIGALFERGYDALGEHVCDICGQPFEGEKFVNDGGELAHRACIRDWFRRNYGAEALS